VIAIVAGTRTKSGSTNFLRLHVLGEQKEGVRFFAPHHEESMPDPTSATDDAKPRRSTRKAPLRRYPSPNPPKISNP